MTRTASITILAAFALASVVGSAIARDAEAEKAVLELQRFYRSNTICERVSIEVRTPLVGPVAGTKVSRSSMNVTLKPGEPFVPLPPEGQPPSSSATKPQSTDSIRVPAALGLELRDLRIWVADRTLFASHSRDNSSYAEQALVGVDPGPRWLTSRGIARVVPPLLVPQLDFASAPIDTPTSDLFPYATNIRWTTSQADPKQPHRRTIEGVFDQGTVKLTTALGRLRSMTIDRPADKFTIDLSFALIGSCDPSKAMIDTSRRTRLPSIGDLRPRTGSLRMGVRAPELALSKGVGGVGKWSMDELLAAPVEAQLAGVPMAEHAVLIFVRQVANPLAGDAAKPMSEWKLDLSRLGRLMSQMRRDAFMASAPGPAGKELEITMPMARFGMAPVLVMAPPTADELIKRLRDATDLWGQDVLWTTDARGSIDLFAPGADVAAVVLDAEMVLRAVIAIDSKMSAEQAADQIAAALFEVAPQQSASTTPHP